MSAGGARAIRLWKRQRIMENFCDVCWRSFYRLNLETKYQKISVPLHNMVSTSLEAPCFPKWRIVFCSANQHQPVIVHEEQCGEKQKKNTASNAQQIVARIFEGIDLRNIDATVMEAWHAGESLHKSLFLLTFFPHCDWFEIHQSLDFDWCARMDRFIGPIYRTK